MAAATSELVCRVAEERHQFMEAYVTRFLDEWDTE